MVGVHCLDNPTFIRENSSPCHIKDSKQIISDDRNWDTSIGTGTRGGGGGGDGSVEGGNNFRGAGPTYCLPVGGMLNQGSLTHPNYWFPGKNG